MKIIAEIRKTGFFDSKINPEVKNEVLERQKQGRFANQTSLSRYHRSNNDLPGDYGYCSCFSNGSNGFPYGKWNPDCYRISLIVSTLTLFSKEFQKIYLKEGRDIKEIDKFPLFNDTALRVHVFALVMTRQ